MLAKNEVRSERFVNYLERKRQIFNKERYQLLSSILGIIIFLFTYLVIIGSTLQQWIDIPFAGFFSDSLILTAMGQIQILIDVFLVLINRRMGYIVALILNFFALISTSINYIIAGTTREVQGIISTICYMIIVTIIYIYVQFSQKKYEEARNQQEQIMTLYEENAASKMMLEEQKVQLERYNSILKEREKELNSLAYYDPLTGLPNRRKFMNRIEIMLQRNSSNMEPFAIVFIDLDNFKGINDSAGHEVGDDILRVVSTRWRKVIRFDDMLGRIGGDEFAIILYNISEEYQIRAYLERLKYVMNEKVFLNHREFVIKASFGVSIYPRDGITKEQLLKHADIAMYAAKTTQSNEIRFFNQSLKKQVQHMVTLHNMMQQIFTMHQLSTVYQPQYSMNTEELRGFEVFARWMTGNLGQVLPREFIPISEESGMILEIGEWILRRACQDCYEWMSWYRRKLILVVNVSGIQLLDCHFIEKIKKIMDDTQFDISCLEIDVSEKVFDKFSDQIISVLKQLQELGVSIAVDDFGTGCLSLNNLKNLPIDLLKIDQQLIYEIGKEKNQEAFIQSVIDLAHHLNIMVIAEGVEHQNEKEYLLNSGCDYAQGYLFGKPENFAVTCNLLEEELRESSLL